MHDLQLRHRKERSMVRWICGVRDDNEVPVYIRFAMSWVQEVDAALRTRRLSLVDTLHFPPRAQGWTLCMFLLIYMETRCTLLLLQMGRHIASSSSCTKVHTLHAPPHAQGGTLCMLLLMHRVWTRCTLLLMHRDGHITSAS